MTRPRRYQNKNITQLLKYKRDMQDEITFNQGRADQLGFGAAADYYRQRAAECRREIQLIEEELAHRGAIN